MVFLIMYDPSVSTSSVHLSCYLLLHPSKHAVHFFDAHDVSASMFVNGFQIAICVQEKWSYVLCWRFQTRKHFHQVAKLSTFVSSQSLYWRLVYNFQYCVTYCWRLSYLSIVFREHCMRDSQYFLYRGSTFPLDHGSRR